MTTTDIAALSQQGANAGANALSRSSLAENFDTFLTLLTSQLQNQDPLSPMDSNQFTQQLVQFSQVEQQIRTNEQLDSLLAQNRAASAGAALSYLGREAVIATNKSMLAEGEARWNYTLGSEAETVRLEIRDARNVTIYSETGPVGRGDHAFAWNGRMTNGQTAPDGAYSLVVVAEDGEGEAISATVSARHTITGLDLASSNPQVITASGAYDLSTIRAILNN